MQRQETQDAWERWPIWHLNIFLLEPVSTRSDQYSLAILTYYLLTGDLPYQTNIAKCKSRKDLRKLYYFSVFEYRKDIPI